MDKENTFKIKPYFKAELARKYQFSTRTFNRVIREIKSLKPHKKHFFTGKEVELIVDYLGKP